MPYNPVVDSKVCRHCSVIASIRETQCRGCGGHSWGPIPDSLLHSVDPDVIRNGHGIIRLDGYRPLTWPPPEAELREEDLPPLPRKDPDTAAMLASLCSMIGIWGVGHIYVGKVITGLSLMITGSIVWGIFVLLTFIGEGPIFYALSVPAWAALIFLAYPTSESDPLRGRRFILPGIAITLTTYMVWSNLQYTYVFVTIGITAWVYLTIRAFTLANEYNDELDRSGLSLW